MITANKPAMFQKSQSSDAILKGCEQTGSLYVTRIEGALDSERLRQVAHEVILTSLPAQQGPARVTVNWSTLTAHKDLGTVQASVGMPALEEAPCQNGNEVKVSLFCCDEALHLLKLTCSTTICDATSLALLAELMAHAYSGVRTGEEAPSFEDARILIDEFVASEEAAPGHVFWSKHIGGNGPRLSFERACDPQTHWSACQSDAVTVAALANLEDWCKQMDTTPCFFLVCAWQALLGLQSNTEEPYGLGVFFEGRSLEFERVIGPMARLLPLTFQLKPLRRFAQTLNGITALMEEAQEWQECGPAESSPSRMCFQFLPDLHDMVVGAQHWQELFRSFCPATYGLKLVCRIIGGGVEACISYDSMRYDGRGASLLLRQLKRLVEAAMAHPKSPLDRLVLADSRERELLLVHFNQQYLAYDSISCIHTLVARQAAIAPDQLAVIYEDDQLTYGNLNAQAENLAALLVRMGVKMEEPVALCMGRGTNLIVGLLAIMKAGGTCLGLDIGSPIERLTHSLLDSQCRLYLTNQALDLALGTRLPDYTALPGQRLDLGQTFDQISQPLELATVSSQLAYMIYTSGSTGKPKAVMVAHYSLVNLLAGLCERVYHDLGDTRLRVSLNAPISFDASMQQVAMLMNGHSLCIVPDKVRMDGVAFLGYIQRHCIQALDCTPSHLNVLLDAGLLEVANPLKKVLVAGGAVSQELWARLADQTGIDFYNIYGPTECTVDATGNLVEGAHQHPSIGPPLGNYSIYLVDRYLELVPGGFPGQVAIAGPGLARGYWGRPGLTAQKFCVNPFGESGDRIYLTGDLARYREDDRLEFLGRIDFQVKIRGYRIELEEIEKVLVSHPEVSQGVVEARVGDSGEPYLVGYVVTKGADLDDQQLGIHLGRSLPEYMVPSVFVKLEHLPLLASGKVNRKLLPEPSKREAPSHFVAPQSEVEKKLAEIWSQVLGIEQIGIDDNFFQLGGDSILNLQVVARANRAGLKITIQQLFNYQTIAKIAPLLEVRAVNQGQGEKPVVGRTLLTPIQHSFFEQNRRVPQHFNQAVLLKLKQTISTEVLTRCLQQLCTHHDVLRSSFFLENGRWQQEIRGVSDAQLFYMVEHDLAGLEGEALAATHENLATQAQEQLDLAQGPLFAAALFHFDGGGQNLLLFAHHLVVDGVSWRFLIEDLEFLLEAARHHKTAALPAKTTSWKEWSECLHAFSRSAQTLAERGYWQQQASATQASLPCLDTHGSNTLADTQTLTNQLSIEETDALLRKAPAAYNTRINDLLLSALVLAVGDVTHQYSLKIHMESHGREPLSAELDLSRTCGWFTSLYPLHLHLDAGLDPRTALITIKEQVNGVPRGGIGYGLLRYAGPDGVAPLPVEKTPWLSFNYLGQFDNTLAASTFFEAPEFGSGLASAKEDSRPYLLDVYAMVSSGSLSVNWVYSDKVHDRETIQHLAESFTKNLRALIAHCVAQDTASFTPSDFHWVQLESDELDKLFDRYQQVEEVYPLTPMQQGMLYHSLYDPSGRYFTEQTSLEIQGSLDLNFFRQAWQDVVDRHALLRSVFVMTRAAPVQWVLPGYSIEWNELDWSEKSDEALATEVKAYLNDELEKGFELAQQPPLRFTVIRKAGNRTHFIWTYHHLLADGWSVPILFGEVATFYAALVTGDTPKMPSPVAYDQYLQWLTSHDQVSTDAFWKNLLQGFNHGSLLPANWESPGEQAYVQRMEYLDQGLSADLQALAGVNGLTINTIFQGAWALLLSHYSATRDVVFGVTVSGRPPEVPDIDRMIGLFINTLPLRVHTDSNLCTIPWLKALQQVHVDTRRFEFSSLADIQRACGLGAGESLFESLVVFENYPVDKSFSDAFSVLSVDDIQVFEKVNYPITVISAPGKQLLLKILYDSKRFGASFVESVFAHFGILLKAMLEQPDTPVNQLPYLSKAERQYLLQEVNQTEHPHNTTVCVLQLVAQRAQQFPDFTAVEDPELRLTYGELEHQANCWSGFLRTRGIGPEQVVALIMEQSCSLVLAALAVLKAGGAYVPVSPASTEQRLRFTLEDSAARVVLTHSGLNLPTQSLPVPSFCMDQVEVASYLPAHHMDHAQAEHLAYIIYTSGSTGVPKGVEVTHRSLLNLIGWHQRVYQVTAQDRVSLLANPTFDASVWETMPYLAAGAALMIPDEDTRITPARLYSWLGDQRITLAFCATPMAEALLAVVGKAPAFLRALLTGGDKLRRRPTKDLGFALVNHYGPTETTVVATWAPVTCTGQGAPTIGHPIDNTQTYVLASDLRLVAPGCVGQLYIGGKQLARGYHQRASLTASAFVPDPFSAEPGGRLYASGDLVRLLRDGLHFVSRMDHQVKIRGMRIELGEIEVCLNLHPCVTEAVAMVQVDMHQANQLIAFAVVKDGACASALLSHLAENLPHYMVPTEVVLLDRLPRNVNGKVDRSQLVSTRTGKDERQITPPRNPTETELLLMWRQVLGQDLIDIHDNFFVLGGHSLTGAVLAHRISETFAIGFSLKTFFESPTIATLAEKIHLEQVAASDMDEAAELLASLSELSEEEILAMLSEEREKDQ